MSRIAPLLLLCTMTAALSLPGSAAADADKLYGIHFWGYEQGQPIDTMPNELLDLPTYSAWDTEVCLTHGDFWWKAYFFLPLYQELATNRNVSMITRIDYKWTDTVPYPSDMSPSSWAGSVVTNTVNVLAPYCHIWVIGNEPNIYMSEESQWPARKIPPEDYAAIYATVRQAIHDTANASPLGEHKVLLAPVSPGGEIAGVRWMSGDEYLRRVMEALNPEEIDGYAVHAYGGGVSDFHQGYSSQMNIIFRRAANAPVYMTEWNRYASPGMPEEEAAAAQFCRDAFADVASWNASSENDIVAMTWFVYDHTPQWAGYSIEHWYYDGYPVGDYRDLWTAFEQTVDLRYPAGQAPTGPPRQNDAATKDDAPDTFASAVAIDPGDYLAWCGASDPDDYYAVSVAAGRQITASVIPSSGRNIDLYLYDPSGGLVDQSTQGGDAAEEVGAVSSVGGDWRVRAHTVSGSGYYDLSITVLAPGEENLALSAVIYLESGHNLDDQRGKYAIDDTVSTKWCAFPLGISTPQVHTLALDLGTTAAVSHFVLKHASTAGEPTYYNTREFYIEKGDSLQGPWTTLAHVINSSQEAENTVMLAAPQAMRYVRLRVTSPNFGADWAVRLPEWQVWGVPGDLQAVVFEAEDYDSGLSARNGYDYYDSTTGNSSGAYRDQDVDIEVCSEGGYDVTDTTAYEWLAYPFRCPGGYYDISVRYAAATDAAVHITIDYSNVTGSVPLAATGGGQSWATAYCGRVQINQGWRALRLYIDEGSPNIDKFIFTPYQTYQATTPSGLLQPGWNMVSVPLDPIDPLVPYVWDEVSAAGNDLTNAFVRYTDTYEVYPLDFNTVVLGEGYWMFLEVAAGETIEGGTPASPASIALRDGWNLIGHPFTSPAAWADCQVTDGVETLSIADAEAAGWIQAAIYYFDQDRYIMIAPSGGDDDALRPWRAYWLLANRPGLTLVVPKP